MNVLVGVLLAAVCGAAFGAGVVLVAFAIDGKRRP